jgi:Replication protein A OB domain
LKWSGQRFFVGVFLHPQQKLTKRDVALVDQSNTIIQFTLWGDEARNFEGSDHPVLLVKGAKVGEYNGVSKVCTKKDVCPQSTQEFHFFQFFKFLL